MSFRVTLWRVAAILVLAAALAPFAIRGCLPFGFGPGGPDPQDRFDWVIVGGPRGSKPLVPLPPVPVVPGPPPPPDTALTPAAKLHPQLLALAADTTNAGRTIEVVVVLRENQALPILPERAPRGHWLYGRQESRMRDAIAGLVARRNATDSVLAASFAAYGTVLDRESFWAIRSMTLLAVAGRLTDLARESTVVYVQPRHAGEPPPWPGPNDDVTDDPAAARTLVGSDAYAAYDDGEIGLIDTGVFRGHQLLAHRIGTCWDCVQPAASISESPFTWAPCVPTPLVDLEACPGTPGHGTGSAALMSAGAQLGDGHRGLTQARVNVYRAYRSVTSEDACNADLDTRAAMLAIQKCIEAGESVMLVETQSTGPAQGPIASMADVAFALGRAVVVAPAGNLGANQLGSPGLARTVLAAGAYNVSDLTWYSGTSHGTVARRHKPELELPTSCETAGGPAPDDMTVMGRTSGAAPHLASAALLLRNLQRGPATSIDPGKVHAALILAGNRTATFVPHGAGHLRLLPPGTLLAWGAVTVSSELGRDVAIDLPAGSGMITAAAWWPDPFVILPAGFYLPSHNDVGISLLPPGATAAAAMDAATGVFKRIEAPIQGRVGRWRLRITPRHLVTATQTVYWAACYRLPSWPAPCGAPLP